MPYMPCHQETSQRILGTYLDSHTLTPVSPRFPRYARISFLHYSTGGANRLPPFCLIYSGVCTLPRLPLYIVVFRFAPSDMLNDFSVRNGFDLNRVFQKAHKQLAPPQYTICGDNLSQVHTPVIYFKWNRLWKDLF